MNITNIRGRIAELIAERQTLLDGGMSAAERRALIEAQCRDYGARARVRFEHALATDDIAMALSVRANHLNEANLGTLLAGLLGEDVLAAALCKHVPDSDVPDAADRAARLVAIEAELDRLERQEEAVIVRSEEMGTPIARRSDARAEIVLALPGAPDDHDAPDPTPKMRSTPHRPPSAPRSVPSTYMRRAGR